MTGFDHTPHPHTEARKQQGPVTTAAVVAPHGRYRKFTTWLAVKITDGVGTMECAALFTALALVSLPAAIQSGQLIIIVAWIAQTFLQLVLLSIILLGGNITAAASDRRAEQTYLDAEAVLHEAREIQRHLHHQDDLLNPATETGIGEILKAINAALHELKTALDQGGKK